MSTTVPQVDVRGPRFTAWLTSAVLVTTLLISAFSTAAAAVLLSLQAFVFAISAVRAPAPVPMAWYSPR